MQPLRAKLILGLNRCGLRLCRCAQYDLRHVATQKTVYPTRHLHTSCILKWSRPTLHPKNVPTQNNKRNLGANKRAPSPEVELLRRVNTLVGERNAREAVRVVTCALRGEWPPSPLPQQQQQEGSIFKTTRGSCSSSVSSTSRRAIFSSKAFAAALYACDAASNSADGLSLIAEVRRHANVISADWLTSEHVLFAILRLQCAAGDCEGATHLFAYLEQHKLLRLRSVSVFLHYCCAKLKDRSLAFSVYEKALQHKIELMVPDYVGLGTLCVEIHEPISTLFFILEEMKEHVTVVSSTFVTDVLEPWITVANNSERQKEGMKDTPVRRYHLTTVKQMEEHRKLAPSKNTKGSSLKVAEASMSEPGHESGESSSTVSSEFLTPAYGVCPACRTELSGYAFTSACRSNLLDELKNIVIPQACRTRRALLGFEHWKRYIHARHESKDRVDVFLDGANLGFYGLSSWYDLAKKQLLLHRGVPESEITAKDLDFSTQCKASGKGVDVGVNFELIDSAVQLAVGKYGLRRPLVMLHERHVEPRFMTPQSTAIVQRWRSLGWLYCTPTGLNDDLCWLYGALLMTDPTDRTYHDKPTADGQGSAEVLLPSSVSKRTFVCTNDKMRDHHFRLLSPRAFTRWRDRHRVGFRCARVEGQTQVHWDLPAPYERCIQRHDAVQQTPPRCLSTTVSLYREGENAGDRAVSISTWHIPFSTGLAVSSATAEELSASSSDKLDGDPITKPTAESDDELNALADIPTPSPWICLVVEA